MEKYPEQTILPGGSTSGSDGVPTSTVDWTQDEEKKLVQKLDFTVLPLLTMVFFALQLDRGNIGSALNDNFLKDAGITQYQYNIGQQLLSAGIVILEIPSNLLLYRFGPRVWISSQIFAWGLVATFQAFQHGLGAYLSTRLLLGLCEAGFIPGGLYTLSLYYKKEETSKRFAIYFFGNNFASACTGLLAYGILHMRGIAGLAGWRWMFLIEGIFTILCGVVFLLCIPLGPQNPATLFGYRYFTEREEHILCQRVLLDDPSKEKKSHSISKKELLSVLGNWKIYPHVLISLCGIAPATTMSSYAPSLVKNFGYDRLKATAMVSVGPWIQIFLNYLSGYLSDKTNRRGYVNLGGLLMWWGFSLGSLILADTTQKEAKYAMLVLAMASSTIWHPVNGSWLSMNARSPAERSITMAMFVSAANLGGIIGGQLFQADDAPHYKKGWTAIVCLISVSIAANLFANGQYRILNRRARKHRQDEPTDEKNGDESQRLTWNL
ncbi:alternative sulfate transporter [Aureobasidium pullulans]|nr:alternative sulfate transporter [Aureobasidium pullulans]